MRSIKEANVKGKRVLVRVDFNVPIKNGKVTDDKRIRAALQTINYLIKKKARIVLLSHLGRPNGKAVEEFRLQPVSNSLSKLIKRQVFYQPDCIGSDVEEAIDNLREGDVLLLENVRFYPEEEANDEKFALKLAETAEIYVNDAFGTAHRAHASVHAITKYLPSYAGFLLLKEVQMLSKLLKNTKKPFIAIMGGAKVSDKINVIENLMKKVDSLLIGGAMAFTFLKAIGHDVGQSRYEQDKVNLAKNLLRKYKKRIILPTDFTLDSKKTASSSTIPKNAKGLDIGPETTAVYSEIIKKARTIFWNGPLGLFEQKPFDKGTNAIAKAIARTNAMKIVGGGDSIAAIEKLKLEKKFTHVSTGGGASLEFLEGKTLPGIRALD